MAMSTTVENFGVCKMKPMPSLIPRFNFEYSFNDFIYGVKPIFAKSNFDFSQLESLFGKRSISFTNLGRSSLYIILKALNLPPNSKIGVPLYLCTVVFDAIIKAGHVPYFIDIDLNNYTLDPSDLKEKIENVDAIVVVHTFGRPTDMDKIVEIAKTDGIPVIEDCAHSLLSEYKGKKTGTIGDASFFSLAKYISAGGGGMIILNNEEFKENFQREMNLLNSPSILNESVHSLYTYLYSVLYHKPWFGTFTFPIVSYIRSNIKSNDINKEEFCVTKIRKNDLGIFLKRLKTFRDKVKLQRENSQILIEELQDTSLILPFENTNTWCNYFLFPVLFDSKKKRDLAHKYLINMGVDTAKKYHRTPLAAGQIYGYKGNCPNSEKCADMILNIPNYYTLTRNNLSKIVNNIKKVEKIL